MHLNMTHMPAANERLVVQDGMMNPIWFAWFKSLEKALHEVEPAAVVSGLGELDLTNLQSGDTLRWDAAQQRWRAGV